MGGSSPTLRWISIEEIPLLRAIVVEVGGARVRKSLSAVGKAGSGPNVGEVVATRFGPGPFLVIDVGAFPSGVVRVFERTAPVLRNPVSFVTESSTLSLSLVRDAKKLRELRVSATNPVGVLQLRVDRVVVCRAVGAGKIGWAVGASIVVVLLLPRWRVSPIARHSVP